MRVAMPALVFNALTGGPLRETMDRGYLAGYCAGSLLMFGVGFLGPPPAAAAVGAMQGLGMSVSNSGSIGYPIAALVIGPGSASMLAQTMVVENLVMIPLGLALAEMAGARPGRSAACSPASGARWCATRCSSPSPPGWRSQPPGWRCRRPWSGRWRSSAPRRSRWRSSWSAAGSPASGGGRRAGRGGANRGRQARRPAAGGGGGPAAVPGLDPVLLAGGLLFAGAPMMSIYPIFGARFGMGELSATALLATTIAACATSPASSCCWDGRAL